MVETLPLAASMNIADCYQVLGLSAGASFGDVKAAYRRLARQHHPDVSAVNHQARDRFIEITNAYKHLMRLYRVDPQPTASRPIHRNYADAKPSQAIATLQVNPRLSSWEQHLKQVAYEQLQQFLQEKRFPRAIALAEALSHRMTDDPEVVQWQAITYQRWGRHLIQQQQPTKARNYLKKALQTDPHNRSLQAEIAKDFRHLEQLLPL
jgi:curved DNA-binding protein CbpA